MPKTLIGDCRNQSLVESLFGSVSEFACIVEEHGDSFTSPEGLTVLYTDETDIHTFWL